MFDITRQALTPVYLGKREMQTWAATKIQQLGPPDRSCVLIENDHPSGDGSIPREESRIMSVWKGAPNLKK